MYIKLAAVSALLTLGSFVQAAFNQGAINAFNVPHPRRHDQMGHPAVPERSKLERRQSRFLNSQTQKFVVDGTGLPLVNFDIGESYAGLLPISQAANESRQLFFWFFPTENPDAGNEVVIWFNGGPGCSSLSGLLTENGPFLWQAGTLAPVPNSYSWSNLTNVLFVEQPIGVGFTQGTPNITNEVELGLEFIGFYQNFVDAFKLDGVTTYITGESYAGYYVPYVADAFITAADDKYFKLGGVAINDPILGDRTLQQQAVIYPFVEYWNNLMYLNDSYLDGLRWTHEYCNYSSYLEKYATFPPPPGPFPVLPDPYGDESDPNNNYTCDVLDYAYIAALASNPCFNIYHISDTCPYVYSHLGIVNTGDYSPPGSEVYFNRSDVQAAINAPVGTHWLQCSNRNVFGLQNDNDSLHDTSLAPAQNEVLRRVIEHTQNTIIGVGRLDFLLPPNGTLFALQNVTWSGLQGFQAYPQDHDFFVPYHLEYNGGRLSESGVVGQWGSERGLTYYEVQLAGHELPGYSAGSGFRVLELLLGRIASLGDRENFSTQLDEGDYGNNVTLAARNRKREL